MTENISSTFDNKSRVTSSSVLTILGISFTLAVYTCLLRGWHNLSIGFLIFAVFFMMYGGKHARNSYQLSTLGAILSPVLNLLITFVALYFLVPIYGMWVLVIVVAEILALIVIIYYRLETLNHDGVRYMGCITTAQVTVILLLNIVLALYGSIVAHSVPSKIIMLFVFICMSVLSLHKLSINFKKARSLHYSESLVENRGVWETLF